MGASAVVVVNLIEPEILEAMACNEGLNLPSDLYLSKVQAAIDCMANVKHLKEPYRGSSNIIIEEIKAKIRDFKKPGLSMK